MSLNTVIIGDFSYPYGSAASSRMRNFAAGLKFNGYSVLIVSLGNQGSRIPELDPNSEAIFLPTKVPTYGLRNTKWTQKFSWLFKSYLGAWLSFYQFRKIAKNDLPKFIILYGRSFAKLFPYLLWARYHKIKVVLDCVELTSSFSGKLRILNPVYWDWCLGERFITQKVDAISAITKGLSEAFESISRDKIIIIPSIEDYSTPRPLPDESIEVTFNLVYVGALLPRDNPEFIYKVMSELVKFNNSVILHVVGKYQQTAAGLKFLEDFRTNEDFDGRIMYHGALSDDELKVLVSKSSALFLSRRNSVEEINAFPTRLVEFLKSGKPVFACDVGDISIYLRDDIDAYLLDTKNPLSAAQKISVISSMHDRGKRVGLQGWSRGLECFERNIHMKRLIDVINLGN